MKTKLPTILINLQILKLYSSGFYQSNLLIQKEHIHLSAFEKSKLYFIHCIHFQCNPQLIDHYFACIIAARSLICYCDGSCPDNASNGTCETRPGGSCFSAVEEVYDEGTGTYEEERTYGCMPPEENGGLLMVSLKPTHFSRDCQLIQHLFCYSAKWPLCRTFMARILFAARARIYAIAACNPPTHRR